MSGKFVFNCPQTIKTRRPDHSGICGHPAALVCCILCTLVGCVAQPGATVSQAQAQAPALQPNMARVWVLRQPRSPGGNIAASGPMVFAKWGTAARKVPREPFSSTIYSRGPTA